MTKALPPSPMFTFKIAAYYSSQVEALRSAMAGMNFGKYSSIYVLTR